MPVGARERTALAQAGASQSLPHSLSLPATAGDDVRDDVGGAQRAGMRGVLVQTGKHRPGDESLQGVEPDATVPDFAAAVEWILQQQRQ